MDPGQKLRILVVDDDASQRMLIAAMIEELGFDVSLASSGLEALDLIDEIAPSIVISDCLMPEMDGWNLCRRIREAQDSQYLYVILLTAEPDSYDVSMESGANDFIQKPLARQKLALRLKAATRVVTLDQDLRHQNECLKLAYQEQCKDLRAARKLQREMMPQDKDYGTCSFISRNFAATEVSGDMQSHFLLPDRGILFFQADVVGHGLRAALLSVSLARILNAKFCAPDSATLTPGAIVSRLNTQIQSQVDSIEYFTIILGVVYPERGELRFCQAGHTQSVIHRKAGDIESVGTGGLPVGLFREVKYKTETIGISSGDRIWLMTDGVSETLSPTNQLFGDEKINALLASTDRQSTGEQMETLIDALKIWSHGREQNDDISIMSIAS